MSEQIGQTGRKKDQKGTVLLKSRIFFLSIKCKRKFKEEKQVRKIQEIWLSKKKRSS